MRGPRKHWPTDSRIIVRHRTIHSKYVTLISCRLGVAKIGTRLRNAPYDNAERRNGQALYLQAMCATRALAKQKDKRRSNILYNMYTINNNSEGQNS
jgi:hypothetical protein